ncbi:hypothetical protein Bca101_081848 [Brassica carinata]
MCAPLEDLPWLVLLERDRSTGFGYFWSCNKVMVGFKVERRGLLGFGSSDFSYLAASLDCSLLRSITRQR